MSRILLSPPLGSTGDSRSPADGTRRLTDRYCRLLAFLLAGLAIGGKGFAYLGIPPIYITEVVLGLGVLAWLRTGCLTGSLASLPGLILLILMFWVGVRTIPFLRRDGVDALRDSVLVFYGVYAFVVTGLLLQCPARMLNALAFLRWFTGLYVFAGPAVFLLQNLVSVPQLQRFLRPDELGVHLSACAALAVLGFRPVRLPWLCGLLLGLALVASQTRGGLLAFLVPVAIATVISPARWRVAAIAVAALAVLGVAYAADLGLPKPSLGSASDNDRALTVRQAVDNMMSMVSQGEAQQDATKIWREAWWDTIFGYTVHGRYFWTGKGFGVNLAQSDGFVAGSKDVAPLRSPHSSHLNILARTGVPGFVLWMFLLLSWVGTILAAAVRAARHGHTAWRNLLVFTLCYWTASLIDSSFDVALEGPMIGAWFWAQTGFGIGLAMLYHAGLRDAHSAMLRGTSFGSPCDRLLEQGWHVPPSRSSG